MKKVLLLLFLILIPSALAITTDLKAEYQPRETAIVEITGNILQPISNSDIKFRRNHVLVPFDYDLRKLEGRYFLYFQNPNSENNYTLEINNIATTEAGIPTTLDFSQDFITKGVLADYSIKPGFAITSTKDIFDFIITSYTDDSIPLTIDYPSSQTFNINPGRNSIPLSFSGADPGLRTIQFGIYSVPVLVIQGQIQNPSTPINTIKFIPENIKRTLLVDSDSTIPFKIENFGTKAASNLFFSYNQELFDITPSTISTLNPNSTKEFNLTLISQNNIKGLIYLNSGDFSVNLSIEINYTSDESQVSLPDSNVTTPEYFCPELSGTICSADQTCSTDLIDSKDGKCCTGQCIKPGEKSYAWVGWTIGGIVLLIIIWLAIKYRKSKSTSKKKNPLHKTIPPKLTKIPPIKKN